MLGLSPNQEKTMTFHSYVLLEYDRVLLSQPELIKQYGRLKAQFLCQLHYWEQKGQGVLHQGRRWVYNTADAWAEQLHISAGHFKRIIKDLAQDGVILIDKLSHHKSNRTNYYAINHEALRNRCQVSDVGCQKNITPKRKDEVHIMLPPSEQNETMVIQSLNYKDSHKSNFVHPDIDNSTSKVRTHEESKACDFDDLVIQKSTKLSPTLVKDMLEIWKNEVPTNREEASIKLNRTISKFLLACFKYKFNHDLNAWKHYCQLIASSPYLMGKDFVLSLNWAVKFTTIDRILAGELGVGRCKVPERSRTEEELAVQALAHVDGVGESEGCKATRRMILSAVGSAHYNAWFTKVDVLDDGAKLKPHNAFVEAAIAARFGDVLERVGR